MKILKKSEALTEANKQKQDQIDEGTAIATRVDTLRRTLADVQKQHEDYIAGMKAQLDKVINPLIVQRDGLLSEIDHAKAELARLRLPLDKEWSDVNLKRAELDDMERELVLKEQDLVKAEADIDVSRGEVFEDRNITAELVREAYKNVQDTHALKEEAEIMLTKAEAHKTEVERILEVRELDVLAKEKELGYRDRNLDNRENLVVARSIELDAKEKFINDKYETLERTINRLK